MAVADSLDSLRKRGERRLRSALDAALRDWPDDDQTLLGRAEHAAEVARMRRASVIALFAWPAFGLVDLYIVLWVEPGRLWFYWLLRLVGLLTIVPAVVRLHQPEPLSRSALRALDLVLTTTMTALVTISCVELGGLASPLVLGVITILVARGAILSDRLRRSIAPVGAAVLVHALGLLLMAAIVPSMRAQLADSSTFAVFVLHQIFVVGAAVLTLIGGHAVWSLRRQVFESRSLGRYELTHRIGAGGMGEVWSAIDKKLQREVAVKLLTPRGRVDLAAERFEREIRATCGLLHPNTVRLFDHGVTDDGVRYYVMERLHGTDLAEAIAEDGPMRVHRAVELIRQTASALAEAHARNIVHRDLKPENIFLARIAGREFVKVLDFGLAHLDDDMPHTREGCAAGSPNYMAPEVLRGAEADARSDVYALGCVLYYLLCGRAPFAGRSVRATLLAHLGLRPDPPSIVRGRPVPERVERILMKCLRKDPRQRFDSARELLDALTRCVYAKRINPLTRRIPASHEEVEPATQLRAPRAPAPHRSPAPPPPLDFDDEDGPTIEHEPPTRVHEPPPRVPRPRATIPPVVSVQPRWARELARAQINVHEEAGSSEFHEVTLDVTSDPYEEITAVESRSPTFH
jgi:serine/threonine-protein kinase